MKRQIIIIVGILSYVISSYAMNIRERRKQQQLLNKAKQDYQLYSDLAKPLYEKVSPTTKVGLEDALKNLNDNINLKQQELDNYQK